MQTQMCFKLSLEKQTLTPAQREALDKCVEITNRVMASAGPGHPQSAVGTHQEPIASTDKPVRVIIEGVSRLAWSQSEGYAYTLQAGQRREV